MYNLNQLSTFVKVAELGSFNKVAEEEFISPNAVMMQINNLEAELGETKLFIRSKRGNRLTPAGELLYKEAKKILNYCEDSKKLVMEAGSMPDNTVRVVVTYGNSLAIFDKLWKELHKRHPEIKLEILPIVYDEKTDKGIWSNFNNWTDMFLCYIDDTQLEKNGTAVYEGTELGGLPLAEFPLYGMMSCNHRLAEKDVMRLEELCGEKVGILSQGWGEKAGLLKEYIENNYKEIKLEIYPYFGADAYNECANNEIILLGGFDSAAVHPFIKAIPFSREDARCDNCLGFVYVNPPSPPIEKFVSAINEIISDNPEIVKFF